MLECFSNSARPGGGDGCCWLYVRGSCCRRAQNAHERSTGVSLAVFMTPNKTVEKCKAHGDFWILEEVHRGFSVKPGKRWRRKGICGGLTSVFGILNLDPRCRSLIQKPKDQIILQLNSTDSCTDFSNTQHKWAADVFVLLLDPQIALEGFFFSPYLWFDMHPW